jgi:ketosteroid isomerase-like protein
MGQELGSLQAQVEELCEAGDAVIVPTLIWGEGRSSGAAVQMRVHQVVTFRVGKIVRRQVFQTLGEALEAVGLSE